MGGDMIEYVYEQETTFAPLPNKFEAGTQNVEGVIGLGAAIDYIEELGYDKIQEIEERIAREDFVRCHTSFLVNFSYVKECTKKKMLLENGKIVDISRSYWKKTEEAYVEWVKRWAR